MKKALPTRLSAALCATLLSACASLPPESGPAGLVDRDWALVSLDERSNAQGAGGKPLTLRLDSKAGRAAGFAGCNRYSAGYELAGNSIRLTAPVSTRMACMEGMDVEQSFLASLPLITSYTIVGRTLTLKVAEHAVATFRTN